MAPGRLGPSTPTPPPQAVWPRAAILLTGLLGADRPEAGPGPTRTNLAKEGVQIRVRLVRVGPVREA